MSHILVAYFSATGKTGRIAEAAARACGGDLFEIRPQKPYTSADLNWTDSKSRSSLEMADTTSRPAIEGPLPDLSGYDTVLLGFPIWWGVEPRVVDTFLDAINASGKRVFGFCTSGGSGSSGAVKRLATLYPSLQIESVKLLYGTGGVENWIRTLL